MLVLEYLILILIASWLVRWLEGKMGANIQLADRQAIINAKNLNEITVPQILQRLLDFFLRIHDKRPPAGDGLV